MKYTKKQIQEAINYWTKQLELGNYKKLDESDNYLESELKSSAFKKAFENGLKQTSPFFYDENNTLNGDILGWICQIFKCKTIDELYNALVSSESEERYGKQTAVDDWDMFYASEQDVIDKITFFDKLLTRFDDDMYTVLLDKNNMIDVKTLENWVENTTANIIEDAMNKFDYRDCQIRAGYGPTYY